MKSLNNSYDCIKVATMILNGEIVWKTKDYGEESCLKVNINIPISG